RRCGRRGGGGAGGVAGAGAWWCDQPSRSPQTLTPTLSLRERGLDRVTAEESVDRWYARVA
ncbi:MAG: hypothetical protein OXG35_04510, partial [Acidobacteria bacterium]|nr:hypothetical protein [Acidobacteriota bacterium]